MLEGYEFLKGIQGKIFGQGRMEAERTDWNQEKAAQKHRKSSIA